MEINIIVYRANGTFISKKINKNFKIKKIYDILEINKNNSYFIFNGKLLNNNKSFSDYNIEENSYLFEQKRLKGGIFSTIVRALINIVKFFILILTYLDDFIMIFVKIIEIIPLIFNPKRLIDDVIFASTFTIKSVVGGMISSVDSGASTNPEEDDPESVPKLCASPSLFKLIILILCPPLSLLMNIGFGLNGLFLVVVCSILTVWCYYFPGLIFAALHIFC